MTFLVIYNANYAVVKPLNQRNSWPRDSYPYWPGDTRAARDQR